MCLHTLEQADDRKKATLILEDGTSFSGYSFGSDESIGGEIGNINTKIPIFNFFTSK